MYPEKPKPPTLGIIAVGIGGASVLMPYFAAVFFVPAAIICGAVTYWRGYHRWGGAAIVLGLIGLAGVIYTSNQIANIAKTVASQQSAVDPWPVVTKAEYDQIRVGMYYGDVLSIIGSQGEELSRSDLAGYTTVMYSWTNKDGSNSNMNAMFQNYKLVTKAQLGLP